MMEMYHIKPGVPKGGMNPPPPTVRPQPPAPLKPSSIKGNAL